MRLREKAGKTQREIATELDVTTQTVSNWETGHRTPRLTPLQTLKLCAVLNCTLEELAHGLIEPSKDSIQPTPEA